MILPNWLTSIPVAHRGVHDAVHPENSLGAFQAAVDAGFPMEMDLHLISDGSVAVFHDQTLKRMTGHEGAIFAQTKETLKQFRLRDSTYHIPTFPELLDLVDGKSPLLIEIKNEGKVGALESAVAALLDRYAGAFAIQSFNPYTVAWFAKHRPHFLRGQISGSYRGWNTGISAHRKFVLRNLLLSPVSRPHFIAYELAAMTPSRRRYMKTLFPLPLLLWTATTQSDLDFCRRIGANPIFEGVRPSS